MIVGSNPQQRSESNLPFDGAKSFPILKDWIKEFGDVNIFIINVYDHHVDQAKAICKYRLCSSVMNLKHKIYAIEPDKIIALGVVAAKALSIVDSEYFMMPHPSGKNLALNDKMHVADVIDRCKEYIHGDLNK